MRLDDRRALAPRPRPELGNGPRKTRNDSSVGGVVGGVLRRSPAAGRTACPGTSPSSPAVPRAASTWSCALVSGSADLGRMRGDGDPLLLHHRVGFGIARGERRSRRRRERRRGSRSGAGLGGPSGSAGSESEPESATGAAVLVQTLSDSGPVMPCRVTLSRKQTSVSGGRPADRRRCSPRHRADSTLVTPSVLGIDVLQVVALGQRRRGPGQADAVRSDRGHTAEHPLGRRPAAAPAAPRAGPAWSSSVREQGDDARPAAAPAR